MLPGVCASPCVDSLSPEKPVGGFACNGVIGDSAALSRFCPEPALFKLLESWLTQLLAAKTPPNPSTTTKVVPAAIELRLRSVARREAVRTSPASKDAGGASCAASRNRSASF